MSSSASRITGAIVEDNSAIFIIDPLGEIRAEIERRAWLPGFATTVSYFEFFGKRALQMFFLSQGFGINRKTGKLLDQCKKHIEGLGVKTVTDLLYWFGKITEKDHTRMLDIIKERNNIIHKELPHYRFQKRKQDHFEILLEQSLEIIRHLKSARLQAKPRTGAQALNE